MDLYTRDGQKVRSWQDRTNDSRPEEPTVTLTLNTREAVLVRLALAHMKCVGELAQRKSKNPVEKYEGRTAAEEYIALEARLYEAQRKAGQI